MYRVNFIKVIGKIKQCLHKYRSYPGTPWNASEIVPQILMLLSPAEISVKVGDNGLTLSEKCSFQKQNIYSDTGNIAKKKTRNNCIKFLFFVYTTGDKLEHRLIELRFVEQKLPLCCFIPFQSIQNFFRQCAIFCSAHVPNFQQKKTLETF